MFIEIGQYFMNLLESNSYMDPYSEIYIFFPYVQLIFEDVLYIIGICDSSMSTVIILLFQVGEDREYENYNVQSLNASRVVLVRIWYMCHQK